MNSRASHFPLNVCIRDVPTHRPAMPEGEQAKPGQASDVHYQADKSHERN